MTYKQRAIEACRQLAEKYQKPQGKVFFDLDFCPLCDLYTTAGANICRGCPLADSDRTEGCLQFNSYDAAWDYYNEHKLEDIEPNLAFTARAEFFDKIIPILEKLPARKFTPSGWTYFSELDRDW